MSKMILNITATLFSALMLWNCVEDESTLGESTVNNDNTYSPLIVKAAMNDQQQKVISYFYEGANPSTGMAYNGSTSKTNPYYRCHRNGYHESCDRGGARLDQP